MRILAIALLAVLAAPCAGAEPVRIATWNLFNLHHVEGEPLRPGAVARSDADYRILRRQVDRLGAQIVALQEVNGPRAARRIFPEASWELHFSGRYLDDVVTGRSSDRIYTGFAVARGVFDSVVKRDVPELGIETSGSGRPLRWGTEILVERGGGRLRLLVVHLKSGCQQGSLTEPGSDACRTLARQRAPLEDWIDAAAREQVPFVVLGDFNRRIDIFDQDDHLWEEIDDGQPPGLDLSRFPFRQAASCWVGSGRYREQPIDFLVFDRRALARVVPGSFRQIDYDAADRDEQRGTPSDHCPMVIEIDL